MTTRQDDSTAKKVDAATARKTIMEAVSDMMSSAPALVGVAIAGGATSVALAKNSGLAVLGFILTAVMLHIWIRTAVPASAKYVEYKLLHAEAIARGDLEPKQETKAPKSAY